MKRRTNGWNGTLEKVTGRAGGWVGLAVCMVLLWAGPVAAQSVAERVRAVNDGKVRMSFAAKPGVCGDGQNIRTMRHTDDWEGWCENGPGVVRERTGSGSSPGSCWRDRRYRQLCRRTVAPRSRRYRPRYGAGSRCGELSGLARGDPQRECGETSHRTSRLGRQCDRLAGASGRWRVSRRSSMTTMPISGSESTPSLPSRSAPMTKRFPR